MGPRGPPLPSHFFPIRTFSRFRVPGAFHLLGAADGQQRGGARLGAAVPCGWRVRVAVCSHHGSPREGHARQRSDELSAVLSRATELYLRACRGGMRRRGWTPLPRGRTSGDRTTYCSLPTSGGALGQRRASSPAAPILLPHHQWRATRRRQQGEELLRELLTCLPHCSLFSSGSPPAPPAVPPRAQPVAGARDARKSRRHLPCSTRWSSSCSTHRQRPAAAQAEELAAYGRRAGVATAASEIFFVEIFLCCNYCILVLHQVFGMLQLFTFMMRSCIVYFKYC
jgi:hypothetical protein